jgi:predicted metal-dependent phosphoesterase TrpH
MSVPEARDALRIDCHVHTADSYDSSATVEAIVRQAEAVGIDGFVVTDHDRIERSLRAAERASDYGLIGIPGVEVSTADGHLLAIGVTSRPEPGWSLDRTVETVRHDGGVAVIPHPFQRTRHGVSAAAVSACDGVEVFNAHSLTGVRNAQAMRFARANNYPRFGGSDAHRPSFVGRGLTYVETDRRRPTAVDVLDAMRAGRVRAGGRRTPSLRYLGKLVENARIRGGGVTMR